MPTPKKKAPSRKKESRLLVLKTEETPLRDLTVYHQNPNTGNVDLIAKSLHINGLFRPIVVNIGTHTGRPNEILAGNHTYLAARKPLFWQVKSSEPGEPPMTYDKPAWDSILCSFVDVDDAKAAQIVAVDNKAAKAGTIDDEMLYKMFEGIPELNLDAAGYSAKEWSDLSDKFKPEDLPDFTDAGLGLDDDSDDDGEDEPIFTPPKYEDTDLGDEGEATDDAPSVTDRAAKDKDKAAEDEADPDDPEGAGIEITMVDEEIKGAFDLKEWMYFDNTGYWQIPKLRPDMFAKAEDIPESLTTWAGSATRYDDDPDTWWLYNYGVDSTSGMKDVSKVIMSFYTYDEYFEPIWFAPKKFVSKVLNSGIKNIVTVDFSDDTFQGRAFCLYQLYRTRWLGRYFQEAGLKLILNLSWPDGDREFLEKITLPTLPNVENIEVVSLQVQTIHKTQTAEEVAYIFEEIQVALDYIKPKMILVYGGQPGHESFRDTIKTDAEVRYLLNRQAKLSAAAKGKKKKDTI